MEDALCMEAFPLTSFGRKIAANKKIFRYLIIFQPTRAMRSMAQSSTSSASPQKHRGRRREVAAVEYRDGDPLDGRLAIAGGTF